MFFKDKFDELTKFIDQIGTRLRAIELKLEEEENNGTRIDQEIEDNKEFPFHCHNILVQYSSGSKSVLSGYQKYRLLNIISSDKETIYDTLTSFYCILDANERMMLISTLLSMDVEDYDGVEDNYLLQLIQHKDFIFTTFEMTMVTSYILQQEAYFLVKPLTAKYALPQYLADMLNSRAILNTLAKEE